jgi:hypothetical protein
MAFPLDEILLGPKAYGVRKGTEMIVLHTTEGAGPTRQNALDTIRLQSPGGSLYAGGGSYHFLIYDGGVFLTVPYLESAGSLTADHTPPTQLRANGTPGVWQPKAWILSALSAAAEADTNAYVLTICFSGKAADLAAGRYPQEMFATAARIIRWAEQQAWCPDNVNVAAHSDFQTNRSDPGAGVVDKVLATYAAIHNPPPALPPTLDYAAMYEAERQKLIATNASLAAAKASLTAKDAEFDAAGAAIAVLDNQSNAQIEVVRARLRTGRTA